MDYLIVDDDIVVDCDGNIKKTQGDDETLQRIKIKLMSQKGFFSLDKDLGSELYKALSSKPSHVENEVKRYIYEALFGEEILIDDIKITVTDNINVKLSLILNNTQYLTEVKIWLLKLMMRF